MAFSPHPGPQKNRIGAERRIALTSRPVLRFALSAGLVAGLLAACVRLPGINDATVALLLVLCIGGIALQWGWAEALAAAILAGIGFDYYFLGDAGFAVTAPEYGMDLLAFFVTAIATGQLAARLKRRQIEAVKLQAETEKLYRLVNAMMDSASAEATLAQLADKVAEIFGADGVALCDRHLGQIVRAGPRGGAVTDRALREVAVSGYPLYDTALGFSLAPIRYGGELGGSIAIHGGGLSGPVLGAIAARVGIGMARLHAIEKSAEAEIVRQAEELKSAVLDAMAHDIRNPLNSAKLAVTALLSRPALAEPQKRELFTIIDEELDRMDDFIEEAMQVARLEADQLTLKKESQDLARLIPDAVGAMGALGATRPIHVLIPETLRRVECDKDMMLGVLKQLLNNALKYTPEDSPLTVSAIAGDAAIVISVADCGPGIAEDEREHIFEKFYRGRGVRSTTRGTGLGLASAKSIVHAHGGEIWVTCPPEGGTTFHVSLPVASAYNAAVAAD